MSGLDRMRNRVGYFGEVKPVDIQGTDDPNGDYKEVTNVHDQWTRMREDKLRSMRKALYHSYQAAVIQPYIAAEGEEQTSPYFRCLINHDKLKVDYEDKILSIPFVENTVSIDPVRDNRDKAETNIHPGTVFKWVHGNKETWIPDSYWIVYLQHVEETAYFRGEIRKANDEIEITTIDEDGKEHTVVYRGWTSGPDETSIIWNVKKGVVWNDLNYTKTLFIPKDETTIAFFKRFDRVRINGQWWEVQAYNANYGTTYRTAGSIGYHEYGIIRVALKETYTDTDQQIKDMLQEIEDTKDTDIIGTSTSELIQGQEILGAEYLSPYDVFVYRVPDGAVGAWDVQPVGDARLEDLLKYEILSDNSLQITILTTKAYKKGFYISYGDLKKHIYIKSL